MKRFSPLSRTKSEFDSEGSGFNLKSLPTVLFNPCVPEVSQACYVSTNSERGHQSEFYMQDMIKGVLHTRGSIFLHHDTMVDVCVMISALVSESLHPYINGIFLQ